MHYYYLNQTSIFKGLSLSNYHKLLLTFFIKGCMIHMNFEIINSIIFSYEILSQTIENPEKEFLDLSNELNKKNSLEKDSFFFNKLFSKLLLSFFIFILFDIFFEDLK
jgi:hypothetical protein